MRRLAAILALVLGLTLLAAPPASAAVAAPAENRASGSASDPNNLIGIEARLSEDAVRENVALGYDLASDDAVAARAGARYSDDVVKAAQKQFPGKAGKIENHHVEPKYLGGAASGRTVPIDAAYHQQITNEFRRLWPYGQGTPSAQQLERIKQQVYEKYPLPGM
jgi:hypothetical protein